MAGDGTDSPQATLDYRPREAFGYTPMALRDSVNVPESTVRSEIEPWGISPDWLAEDPFSQPMGTEFYRYQYDEIYIYPVRQGRGGDNEYYPIEFRVWINTVGQPIPESLKRHFRLDVQGHLQQLFDGEGYPEGYMSGFNFVGKDENTEEDEIAADEASNLGVPQWEVLVHKGGSVQGHAGGFFDPFEVVEAVPEQEEWNITYNSARNDYEFRPQGSARRRMEQSEPKQVFLNGKYIGQTQPSRGTVYLSKSYSSNDGTWKNTTTGKQMWSRQALVDRTKMSYQAIAAGGKVYKVEETENKIFLVATQPDDWNPTPQEAVPADAGERARMKTADSTLFDIQFDDGAMLGKYDTPLVWRVETQTELML